MALDLNRVVNQPIGAWNPAAAEACGSLCPLQQLVIKPIIGRFVVDKRS